MMDSLNARFPIKGRRIAVAGSGPVADARAGALQGAGAEVVRLQDGRAFEPGAYAGALLAFVASKDDVFAQNAAAAARKAGLPVCAEGRPGLSDFHLKEVPHLPTPESIAAFFKGKGPTPAGLGAFAALLHRMRHDIVHAIPDEADRKAFLEKLAHGPSAVAAAAGDLKGAQKHVIDALSKLQGGRKQAFDALAKLDRKKK
jgi:precorrin-2 dehydrogenase/sirohydrochlorin ferrochelatase